MRDSHHSADVHGWIVIHEQRYELAQIGHDFCIVRGSQSFQIEPGNKAVVVVEIDGRQRSRSVKVTSREGNRINFEPQRRL